jgi:hypothetical protein
MWALPCDVYDLEPRSRYENEEPVLACRETVSWGGNCQLSPSMIHPPQSDYRIEVVLSACYSCRESSQDI